jgi:hypothetical protein
MVYLIMSDKKIIIKKIGSSLHGYLIYLHNQGQNIECYFEKNDEDKKIRVNELILTHFMPNGNEIIMINEIIEEK